MRILFVCNQGKHRSRTAAEMFCKEFETEYAGLYSEKPVTEEQIQRADVIVVMDDEQRSEIAKRFPGQYMLKRIVSLDIADVYRHNQPELVDALKYKMEELF